MTERPLVGTNAKSVDVSDMDMPVDDAQALRARLLALEAENARLLETVEDLEDHVLALRGEVETLKDGENAVAPREVVALQLDHGWSALRAWRKHRGLTLKALAAQVDVSVGYLSDIETRKRDLTLRLRNRLALALDAPAAALWQDDDGR